MNLDEFFGAVAPVLTGERPLETVRRSFTPTGMRAVATYEAICKKRRAEVLASGFPRLRRGVAGALGSEAWEALVEGYFRERGMQSPALVDNGAGFPDFLRARRATGLPEWVSELAELEWCAWRAAVSPDPATTLAPDEGPLRHNPTLELRAFRHDVVDWASADPQSRPPEPAREEIAVAFWRDRWGTAFERALGGDELECLRAVERGEAATAPAGALSTLRSAELVLGTQAAARESLQLEAAPIVLEHEPIARSADVPARDRYTSLLDIVRLLLSEEATDRTAELLFRRVLDLTKADRGFLVVKDGNELQERFDFKLDRSTASTVERRFSRSIVRRALEAREPIFCEDVLADPRFASLESVEHVGARAVLVVPLHHRGEVYGAVYLDRLSPERSFSPDAVAFMTDFAEIAGLFLRRAVERDALRRRTERLEQDLLVEHGHGGIVTRDPRMLDLLRTVCRVADADATVLVRGETGTGKELIARAVHAHSPRKHKPLVVLHTTALPATVLESELFGHVRGAFTGADRDRAGRIASAQGGTLLLDEVAEIPVEMQAKLLRFLQFGEMQRLGSDRIERVDVRVVAATHQDLRTLVESGRFRQDLYYRLKVVELTLPPLRDRRDDIALLVDDFLKRFSRGKTPARFTTRAMARLEGHDWPGNVRELMHVVEHACVVGVGTELDVDALPPELCESRGASRPPAAGSSRPPTTGAARLPKPTAFTSDELEALRESAVAGAEREFLQELFDRCDGNVSRAARESGIHRSYLQRLMARHGIRKTRSAE